MDKQTQDSMREITFIIKNTEGVLFTYGNLNLLLVTFFFLEALCHQYFFWPLFVQHLSHVVGLLDYMVNTMQDYLEDITGQNQDKSQTSSLAK